MSFQLNQTTKNQLHKIIEAANYNYPTFCFNSPAPNPFLPSSTNNKEPYFRVKKFNPASHFALVFQTNRVITIYNQTCGGVSKQNIRYKGNRQSQLPIASTWPKNFSDELTKVGSINAIRPLVANKRQVLFGIAYYHLNTFPKF